MSNNPNSKSQLIDFFKTFGVVLGVPLALFTVVNNILQQPTIVSLIVAFVTAILVSVWLGYSFKIKFPYIFSAWMFLAVIILAIPQIWPKTMTVEGYVNDMSNNPIPNETVQFFDYTGRRYETQTDQNGFYQFVDVPTGKYEIQVDTTKIKGETKGFLVSVVQQSIIVPTPPSVLPSPVATLVKTVVASPPSTSTLTITPTSVETPTPEQSWREREKDHATMVHVNEGTFIMGSSDRQVKEAIESCEQVRKNLTSDQQNSYLCEFEDFADESPLHQVHINAFWLDKTEVTNAQFATFLNEQDDQTDVSEWVDLESKNCLIELEGDRFQAKDSYGTHPAIMVSWYGADAYCNWVGGRLPTEAEWEYAARGVKNNIYPWGNNFNGRNANFCDRNCTNVWRDTEYDDGYRYTSPSGSFSEGVSWSGALDMAGNVWEWTNDLYDAHYYDKSPFENPLGPEIGQGKVIRGGGWDSSPRELRTTRRGFHRPDKYLSYVGFRCVVED